jgi:superoxide dismutase, Cu-Zn family
MSLQRSFGMVLLAAAVASGCNRDDVRQADMRPDTVVRPVAGAAGTGAADGEAMTAQLINREGQQIGTVRLTPAGEGVQVAIEASNLPPGARGIHFHEVGRCDTPSFESAGDHFAPAGRQHGLQNPQGPHAGDMENLDVGQDGRVNTTFTNPRVTLRQGQQNSLVDSDGTALVIHAERDDQRTDPSGESGDRIACAVIGQAGATGAR